MKMRLSRKNGFALLNLVVFSLLGELGCGISNEEKLLSTTCAPHTLRVLTGDSGSAFAFLPDPMSQSGNSRLSPNSNNLDEFRTPVTLSHLTGKGVLQGTYVSVLNGLKCDMGYGAFSPDQKFSYSHQDWRFQEAMAYYLGDRYQSQMNQIGYLKSQDSVRIVAHCDEGDNAFFMRSSDPTGQTLEMVCLYDSKKTPGAYYGDDGIVTIHELEHASTVDNYSPIQDFNQFWFDEAGSLNEAISDFLSMLFTNSMVPSNSPLDLRVFSRWALGTFDKQSSHVRGTHLCPTYDSHYPQCDQFPEFSAPIEQNNYSTTISYTYPDGVGWPYPSIFHGNQSAVDTFENQTNQEEIHNAGIVMEGALWDISTAIKANHSGEDELVNQALQKLVLESIRHLPMADTEKNHSPVTFIRFASELVQYADQISGLTAQDKASLSQALKKRGLYDFPTLGSEDWMEVGSGLKMEMDVSPTPGVFVVDDPKKLRRWLGQIGTDPSIVTQNLESGLNGRLDPGEVVALWFDIQNTDPVTAGGVLVTVTSSDPDIMILDSSANIGFMDATGLNQTQIMYEKINGTSIVAALNPPGGKFNIPISNSYFRTNPSFSRSYKTAIWVKVNPEAEHGNVVSFQVNAAPSNGPATTRNFPVTIN